MKNHYCLVLLLVMATAGVGRIPAWEREFYAKLAPPATHPVIDGKISVASVQGLRPRQEDRYVNVRIEAVESVPRGRGVLMAVMDGFGGSETAEAVRKILPALFRLALIKTEGDVKKRFFGQLVSCTKKQKPTPAAPSSQWSISLMKNHSRISLP